ncbi:MAG: TonB-dependent receptor [Gammaproteobacteria bacterium]|nr:MAG: TonB-dependent receptor [Gammaproteobacteria bacterium]
MHRFMQVLTLGLAAIGSAVAQAPASTSGGEELQEVVVTGSYIRRSSFQQSSPVDVVSREQLDVVAPSTVATFLKDLPQNFGSTFLSGRAVGGAGVGGERGAGTINLRGLGPSSTLVLLNGRRQTQLPDAADNVIDVNSLVPEIAIERLEVLKDGASALYGTDAVAGVVNILTNDRFDGLRVSLRNNTQTYSSKGDRRFEVMAGTGLGERTRLMAAFSMFDQDELNAAFDIPSLKGAESDMRLTVNSSSPGEFTVPVRNAAGALTPATRRNVVDSSCGQVLGTIPTNSPTGANLAVPLPVAQAVDCRYFFYPDQSMQSKIRQYQAVAVATHEFSDTLRFRGEAGFSSSTSHTRYTASDVISLPRLVIPGHNPGSEYRAVDSLGQPLFAVSSGVSAGYSRDGAPVFVPARDAAGRVILTATPTDPSSGIPFYEDVVYTGRPLNSQGALPTNNAVGPGEFAGSNRSRAGSDVSRMSAQLDGTIGGAWNYLTALTHSRYRLSTNGAPGIGLTAQLLRALDGYGGGGCNTSGVRNTGGCGYFNLYGNSAFATSAGDPRANSQEMVDYVSPMLLDRYESTLLVGDAVLTGDLLDLPGGRLGVALGYQYRKADLSLDYDSNKNTTNTTQNTQQVDFSESRDISAYFLELNAPLYEGGGGYLELNGAVRHETGEGVKTTDPKLGLLYSTAGRALALRASYGTSFVAPSLFRLYSVSAGSTAVNDCPVTLNPVCTGVPNIRIASRTSGNPDLEPQTSAAYNFGVTIKPLPGLTASIDWFRFEFDDLISTETATQVVNADPTGQLTGRVQRDANGQLIGVILQYFNAQSVVASGYDFDIGYEREFAGIGRLGFNLSGTYLPTYRWTLGPGQAPANWAGETNDRRPAAPNPEWKANFRVNWSSGPHSVAALLRYTGSLEFTLDPTQRIRAFTPVDLSYTYRLQSGMRGIGGAVKGATVSVGATNVFGEQEPFVPYPGFQPYLGSLHDLRGRFVWAKVTADF